VRASAAQKALANRALRAVWAAEGLPSACKADILYTDDEGIRRLNREHRDTDKPTDVLSFPVWEPGEARLPDPDTGRIFLGDIALSLPMVAAQAAEYGHSPERELAFLVVHAALHLLGYDHEDEQGRAAMRRREEAIMDTLGLPR
jgi:probable rRNA maturation factor